MRLHPGASTRPKHVRRRAALPLTTRSAPRPHGRLARHAQGGAAGRDCPGVSLRTPCGIVSLRTCSRAGLTCASSRNCWVMPASPRHSCTRTSPESGSDRSMHGLTRGPEGGGRNGARWVPTPSRCSRPTRSVLRPASASIRSRCSSTAGWPSSSGAAAIILHRRATACCPMRSSAATCSARPPGSGPSALAVTWLDAARRHPRARRALVVVAHPGVPGHQSAPRAGLGRAQQELLGQLAREDQRRPAGDHAAGPRARLRQPQGA